MCAVGVGGGGWGWVGVGMSGHRLMATGLCTLVVACSGFSTSTGFAVASSSTEDLHHQVDALSNCVLF